MPESFAVLGAPAMTHMPRREERLRITFGASEVAHRHPGGADLGRPESASVHHI
jgi:hypothetical protein